MSWEFPDRLQTHITFKIYFHSIKQSRILHFIISLLLTTALHLFQQCSSYVFHTAVSSRSLETLFPPAAPLKVFRATLPSGAHKVTLKRFGWASQHHTTAVTCFLQPSLTLIESLNTLSKGIFLDSVTDLKKRLTVTVRPSYLSFLSVSHHRGRNIWETIASNLFMLLLYNITASPEDATPDQRSTSGEMA